MTGTAQGIVLANLEVSATPAPVPPNASIGPASPPPAQELVFAPTTLVAVGAAERTLVAGDAVLIEALTPAGGALSHTFNFELGAGATELTIGANWIVSSLAPLRLVGVNIDLLDSIGALVASDNFQGVLSPTAASSIDLIGLSPGEYALRVTGLPTSSPPTISLSRSAASRCSQHQCRSRRAWHC